MLYRFKRIKTRNLRRKLVIYSHIININLNRKQKIILKKSFFTIVSLSKFNKFVEILNH